MVRASFDAKSPSQAAPLSNRAMVATARGRGGKNPPSVRIAADYSSSRTKEPDVLYLDFFGERRFDKDSAIPMVEAPAPKQLAFAASIGPMVVRARRGGKTVPISVRGSFVRIAGRPGCMAVFTFSAALEGRCRFGDKLYPVRMVDLTGDFAFDQKGAYDPKDRRGQGLAFGDMVLIDTGDGSFRSPTVRAYYGQPVFINGAWHQVRISSDGTKVSARPIQRKTGHVSIDSDRWELMLADGKRALCVAGSREPVAVAAGTYSLLCYRQWSAPDEEGRRAALMAGSLEMLRGKAKGHSVIVAAGRTAKLPYGTPVKAALEAKVSAGRSVKLALESTRTQGDLSVLMVTRPGGWLADRPDPPIVEVYDSRGRKVHQGTLEYG